MSRRLVMMVVGIGAMAFALAGCFGNGPHPVGSGPGLTAPGLYHTLGDDGGPCAVTRYDSAGTPHFYSSKTGGPIYLRLQAGDTTVTSSNCSLWQAAGLALPVIEAPFKSGDYRVGFEVQPGMYRASGAPGGDLCKYGVVSDFKHDGTDGTITSVTQPVVPPPVTTITVTIHASDFGFTSENCGAWTKIG